MNNDDIAVWSDGTWCYGDELYQMSFLSDDFNILVYGTEEWVEFLKLEEGFE